MLDAAAAQVNRFMATQTSFNDLIAKFNTIFQLPECRDSLFAFHNSSDPIKLLQFNKNANVFLQLQYYSFSYSRFTIFPSYFFWQFSFFLYTL